MRRGKSLLGRILVRPQCEPPELVRGPFHVGDRFVELAPGAARLNLGQDAREPVPDVGGQSAGLGLPCEQAIVQRGSTPAGTFERCA